MLNSNASTIAPFYCSLKRILVDMLLLLLLLFHLAVHTLLLFITA